MRNFWIIVSATMVSSCSMLIDDEAGLNTFTRPCLEEIRQFEGDASRDLPGNASSVRFTHCEVIHDPFPTIRAIARVQVKQVVCRWNHCVTAWSYTTTVSGTGFVDQDCQLQRAEIHMNPRVSALDSLIAKGEREAPAHWPEFLRRNPGVRELVCGQ